MLAAGQVRTGQWEKAGVGTIVTLSLSQPRERETGIYLYPVTDKIMAIKRSKNSFLGCLEIFSNISVIAEAEH